MERLRTLLLARSHVVVLDPDLVAGAATRPLRDRDLDRLEDELAQLGFVASLDLAMTIRRLPNEALQETRDWLLDTLARHVGVHRPQVPLAPAPGSGMYLRRILAWLATRADQPCPWCARIKTVGALDPCGHLVCRTCWDSASFAGCPICHRRVAIDPFVVPPANAEKVARHAGQLQLVHLGFDLGGLARARLEKLLARPTPLSPDERADVATILDEVGPRAIAWLPATIPVRGTMALAIARLLQLAADRDAIVAAAAPHLTSATDVLRVACVLLGGNAELALPMRFRSIPRGLRRAVIGALDRLPPADLDEDVARHRALWKRVGEQLHPSEHAGKWPTAARVFAIARGAKLARWAAPVEDALRAGDPLAAIARLRERPVELLRRTDQLVRVAEARRADALRDVLGEITGSFAHAAPALLLVLASHVARRGTAWPRRVFFPAGDVLRAWGTADARAPLRADSISALLGALRGELLARAERRRNYPRAVIDRALVDVPVAAGASGASPRQVAWPRGSELALPEGEQLRVVLHGESAVLSLELFDAGWRHVATRAAAEARELHVEPLQLLGARHAVAVVRDASANAAIAIGDLHFDLRGHSRIAVPLAIDLGERRVHWLDAHVRERRELARAGGYRATVAHVARDLIDHAAAHARPTLWDLACLHAAARANVVYVRERDGTLTTYRRRDREPALARLGRLLSGSADSFRMSALPKADAPTWFALVTGDLALPASSVGFALDARPLPPHGIVRVAPADLVAELAR